MLRFATTFLVVAPISFATASPLPQGVVNFPGGTAKVLTSVSGVSVDYIDPAPNAEDHIFALRLRYPNGRIESIHEFGRNVDVSWSPDGRRLFVTDWIGSNVADCIIVTPSVRRARQLSLTDLISRGAAPKARTDLAHNSHGYVSCSRWRAPEKVEVELRGDEFPREFKYRFVYDAQVGRLTSLESSPARE